MVKKVLPGELSKEIIKYLNEYEEDIEELTKDLSFKIGKEAKSEISSISPVGKTGIYHTSWTVRAYKEPKRYYVKVHNTKKYQLSHLLEFGHVTRDGTSRSKKIPHVRPTEHKYMDKFVVEIEKEIRRGV